MKKILTCIVFLLSLYFSYAQPGELDRSFGNKGIVITGMGSSINYNTTPVSGALLLPGGGMYVPISSRNLTSISKYHADGSPDLTYGTNGNSVAVPIYASQSAIQPDGKIVVVGTTYRYDFAIVRFNTNGSLDSTFGGTGLLTLDFNEDHATCVAIQNDGKIVVAGNAYDLSAGPSFIMVFRFNTNGSLDNSFGTGGIQSTGYGTIDDVYSMAIQTDGKIVLGGSILLRYNSDGTLDNSFNGEGRQFISATPREEIAHTIGLQGNGKIVVATNEYLRYSTDEGYFGFILRRYNEDGSVDISFGKNGIQATDFGGTREKANGMAIQSDGKIILAGFTRIDSNANFAIARFGIDGGPDNSFAMDGKQITDFGNPGDNLSSIAIQNDGKLLAIGSSNYEANIAVAVARYDDNGNPDNSLDGNALKVYRPLEQASTYFTCTAVQTDGKVLAAGYAWNGSNYDFAIVRYRSNGSLDNTFSGDGKLVTDFGSSDDRAIAMAIQADGKIVVAGSSGNNFALARYNADGSSDKSFDGDGLQIADFGPSNHLTSMSVQSDGKIVVGGGRVVARYNNNGSPDAGFDGDGMLDLPFDCNAIALQNDGKILVTGGQSFVTVARYNINGSIDDTFGDSGFQRFFSDGDYENLVAKAIAIQNDGKIVIGGYYEFYYRSHFTRFLLTRLNTDGTIDYTFNNGSIVYSVENGYGTSLAIQDDSKIILAGYSPNVYGIDNFTIARFTKNGVLDNTFSEDGIQITPVDLVQNRITGIALSRDKLYAIGNSGEFPSSLGVVAKYALCGCQHPAVVLGDFKAVLQNRTTLLQWQTTSEEELSGFTIERSDDGNSFSSIGYVTATGNSRVQINYSTIDNQPLNGVNFYRLKMVDKKGKFTYSNIVCVTLEDGMITLSVFPNPAANILFISRNAGNEKATVQVIEANGRISKEEKIFLNRNAPFALYISNLPKGMYILQVRTATTTETRRFIKE